MVTIKKWFEGGKKFVPLLQCMVCDLRRPRIWQMNWLVQSLIKILIREEMRDGWEKGRDEMKWWGCKMDVNDMRWNAMCELHTNCMYVSMTKWYRLIRCFDEWWTGGKCFTIWLQNTNILNLASDYMIEIKGFDFHCFDFDLIALTRPHGMNGKSSGGLLLLPQICHVNE